MPFCGECGAKVESGLICDSCGKSRANPEIAKCISYDPQFSIDQRSYATRRFLSAVFDLLFATAVAFCVVIWLAFLKKQIMLIALKKLITLIFPIIVWIVCLLFKDAIKGKSFGKTIFNLSLIVPIEKRFAGPLDSLTRNWPLIIPLSWPFIAFQILRGHKQRFGDSDCIVVHDNELQNLE